MRNRVLTIALLLLTFSAPLAAQDRSKTYVAAVKADLIARGIIPNPQTDNCHAFQIVARVAWGLRAQGARLLTKTPAQNGCTWLGVRYSHDVITFADGWADLLRSAGPPANVNEPDWQWTASGPSAGAVAPFDLDAGTAPPVVTPPPDPVDPPLPPQILTELIAKLFLEVQQLRLNTEALMDALAKVRAEQSDSRIAHAHGLQGSLFGYPVVLKPVP